MGENFFLHHQQRIERHVSQSKDKRLSKYATMLPLGRISFLELVM